MSEPDDIALAVRDQLCIDCVCTFRDGCGCTDTIAAAIEAAILAERERCDKAATDAINDMRGSGESDLRSARARVQQAIRGDQ